MPQELPTLPGSLKEAPGIHLMMLPGLPKERPGSFRKPQGAQGDIHRHTIRAPEAPMLGKTHKIRPTLPGAPRRSKQERPSAPERPQAFRRRSQALPDALGRSQTFQKCPSLPKQPQALPRRPQALPDA